MYILKILKRGIYSVFSLIVFLFVVYQAAVSYSNFTFAKKYFTDMLEIEDVIASKKWHNETFGCTYAAVKYKDGSSPTLAYSTKKVLRNGENTIKPWIGNWEKTPYAEKVKLREDMPKRLQCLKNISPELFKEAIKLLESEGSWYSLSSSEVFLFMSPISNTAIRVRYGD